MWLGVKRMTLYALRTKLFLVCLREMLKSISIPIVNTNSEL